MLKLQYFSHLMQWADSLEKTLMLGKTEGRRRKVLQGARWLDGITTRWTWVWASSGRWWRREKPGELKSMGSESRTQLSDWTTKNGISWNLIKIKTCAFQKTPKKWKHQPQNTWIDGDRYIPMYSYLSSVAQSCPTLCDPMNHSTPGLLVHYHLPEFTQTHVHRVGDAIQPPHPLLSPSPPAPNSSQHQSFPMSQLFAWGGQSTGVSALASLLPKNIQGWSPLEWTGWISLHSKGLSRVFSNTTVQNSSASILQHSAFFTVQLSHPYVTTGKTIALTRRTFVGKVMNVSAFEYAI